VLKAGDKFEVVNVNPLGDLAWADLHPRRQAPVLHREVKPLHDLSFRAHVSAKR